MSRHVQTALKTVNLKLPPTKNVMQLCCEVSLNTCNMEGKRKRVHYTCSYVNVAI